MLRKNQNIQGQRECVHSTDKFFFARRPLVQSIAQTKSVEPSRLGFCGLLASNKEQPRPKSRRGSEAVSSLASGPRAGSLPWFDSPLVQGASRLRYTDKAQMQRPGHTGRKALATKKQPRPKAQPKNNHIFFPRSCLVVHATWSVIESEKDKSNHLHEFG